MHFYFIDHPKLFSVFIGDNSFGNKCTIDLSSIDYIYLICNVDLPELSSFIVGDSSFCEIDSLSLTRFLQYSIVNRSS